MSVYKYHGLLYTIPMAYASLYRKYRPATFDEVVGQDSVVRVLRNMVSMNSIAHAFLFTGTRGTGKTSVARIFARAVNCLQPKDGSPCGECAACKASVASNNVDIVEMDAASNNGVDDIRALRESVAFTPADPSIRYKVYIIDEVHQLTTAAFNAFLKTLEEPPQHCIFILATTEVHKLPQTILSRCLRFDFHLVSSDELCGLVARIFDKEGIRYTKDALLAIAKAGAGSARDTLSIAETCMTASDGEVTYDKVLRVLGANDPHVIAALTRAIVSDQLGDALRLLNDALRQGKNAPVMARDIASYVRDLIIIQSDSRSASTLGMPDAMRDEALEISNIVSRNSLVRAMGIFSGLDSSMRYASNPRLLLENAIARCASMAGNDSIDYVSRLDKLEKDVLSCRNDIQNRPVVQVSAPTQTAAQEQHVQDNATPSVDVADSHSNGTKQALDMAEMEADSVPFDTTPIQTIPTEDNKADAGNQLFRGQLISKLREKMYMSAALTLAKPNAEILCTAGHVHLVLPDVGDESCIKPFVGAIAAVAGEIMGASVTVTYEIRSDKSNFNEVSMMSTLFGASKITSK